MSPFLTSLLSSLKANPNCLLIVTPQGGHLGWIAGDEAPFGAPWTDPVVMEFLEHVDKETKTDTEVECFPDQLDGFQHSSSLPVQVK